MGLYGDKLTKTDGSGVDVLTKSAGTAFDGLTKSAGTAFDGLTKSAGAISDNLIYAAPFGNLIKNSFDWNDPVGGLAAGWLSSQGNPSIITAVEFTGNAQKLNVDPGTGLANLRQELGGSLDGITLRLKFKYFLDNTIGGQSLKIYQGETLITTLTAPFPIVYNVSVPFTSARMSNLIFDFSGSNPDYFIIDEVELYAI